MQVFNKELIIQKFWIFHLFKPDGKELSDKTTKNNKEKILSLENFPSPMLYGKNIKSITIR